MTIVVIFIRYYKYPISNSNYMCDNKYNIQKSHKQPTNNE